MLAGHFGAALTRPAPPRAAHVGLAFGHDGRHRQHRVLPSKTLPAVSWAPRFIRLPTPNGLRTSARIESAQAARPRCCAITVACRAHWFRHYPADVAEGRDDACVQRFGSIICTRTELRTWRRIHHQPPPRSSRASIRQLGAHHRQAAPTPLKVSFRRVPAFQDG